MNSLHQMQNVKKMNNIEIIKDFIKDSTKSKLLVNQVNEEIGSFYVNFFKNEASVKNIELKFTDNEFSKPVSDLFDSDDSDNDHLHED